MLQPCRLPWQSLCCLNCHLALRTSFHAPMDSQCIHMLRHAPALGMTSTSQHAREVLGCKFVTLPVGGGTQQVAIASRKAGATVTWA